MTTNYYDIGYARALEKLGMPVAAQRVLAKGRGVVQKLIGRGGSKATQQSIDFEGPQQMQVPQNAPPLTASSKNTPKGTPVTPVESASTPEAVAAKAKGDPSFLREHWLPIAGGIGAAGLGGYALMANRDSMGGTGQLPSGYGGGY